jgi:C-3',4' desaturase CrtD
MADQDVDVAIIGAGIGGLTTGALLSAKGFKVAVLEQAAHPGGLCASFSREGYTFQTGVNILNGFELGGGHGRVLAELGLLVPKIKLNPGFQIVLPNHRLSFNSDRGRLLAEFEREFPQHFSGIKEFWRTLEGLEELFYGLYSSDNFFSPTTLKEKYIYFREVQQRLGKAYKDFEKSCIPLLKQTVPQAEFKRLLDTLSFFYAQLPLEGCSSLFCAYLIGLARRGIFYINGGIKQLVNQLVGCINKHSGAVYCNSRVVQIITEGRRAVGLRLANGHELRARYIVANMTIWDLYENLLPNSAKLSKKISSKTEDIAPQWVPFSVYLGIDERVLPQEMGENVFLLTDYQQLGDTNTLFVSVSPEWDKERAPEGKRALTATCFLPRNGWERNSNYQAQKERYTEQVIGALSSLITFIDEGIEFKAAATPLTYEKFTNRPQGMVTGLAATRTGFGFNGFSNHTHYKNLYLVGDTCFPGHGTNLVSISALNLARIIERQ